MNPLFLEKFKGKKSQEDNIIQGLYVVMKEFGYTLEELKSLPVPTLMTIFKEMEKEAKEMNKKTKTPRGKR